MLSMRAQRFGSALLATALATAIAGCGKKAAPTPDGGPAVASQSDLCATTPRPMLSDLWPTTFASCAGSACHGGGAGQMLFRTPEEFLAATVRQASSEVPGASRIVPGQPSASLLYQKLAGTATPRMPLGGPYLTKEQLDLVAGWICGGAQPGALPQTDGGSYNLGQFPVPSMIPGMEQLHGECDGGECECDGGPCPVACGDGGTWCPEGLQCDDEGVCVGPCPGGGLSIGGICPPVSCLDDGGCDGGIGDGGGGDGGSVDGGSVDGGSVDAGDGGIGDGGISDAGDAGPSTPEPPVILNLAPTEGYQGTPVQLFGAHFGADCSVDDVEFAGADGGTISGALQSCIPNEVDTAVPPGAVTGPVQLTVAGAGQAKSPVAFTVWSCGAPTLSSISPSEITAGSGDTPIRLVGADFNPGSVVDASLGDGPPVALAVTYESAAALTAVVPNGDLLRPGTLAITVTNPPECVPPQGGTSQAQTLTVTSEMPTLYGVTPEAVLAGSGDTTLTLSGHDFNGGSTVSDNEGTSLAVTSVTPTEIQVTMTADELTAPRVLNLSVSNPDPVGGSPIPSNSIDFSVLNVAPVLASLAPASVAVGSTPELDLHGSGLTSATQVLIDGQPRQATLKNPSSGGSTAPYLEIASLDQQITNTAGPHAVQLVSPPPGGGYSQVLDLTVTEPTPTLTSISLTSAEPCAQETITLTGTGFTAQSVVEFGTVQVTPTSIVPTSLTFQLPCVFGAADHSVDYPVTVQNPDGAASNALTFTLTADADPIITSLSPNPIAPGNDLSLWIYGANFGFPDLQVDVVTPSGVDLQRLPGDVGVDPNGNLLVSHLPLQANSAPYQVTVTRTSDGAKSASVALLVSAKNPTPVLTSLNPASATQGSEAVSLTVKGSGFAPGAHITFNGGPWQLTTVVDPSTATATIPAQLLTGVGSLDVKIVNPPPVAGDGSSNALEFTVDGPNLAPAILSMTPVPLFVASPPAMALTGTNFLPSTTATLDGEPCPGCFVFGSRGSGVVTLPESAVAQAGDHELWLSNPAPGGGDSNPVTVVVVALNPAPTLTSITMDPAAASDTPTTVVAGTSSAKVQCTGTSFMQDSVVEVAFENGGYSARTTSFESATSLAAMLGPADLAVAGTLHVRVENPAPGGGTTDAQDATLIDPIPHLTALDPAIAPEPAKALTLTVWGTGFVGSSQVRVKLTPMTTTFVDSSKLTASVPGATIPATGNYSIDVVNPAPGGGPSDNGLTLYVSPPAPVLTGISPCGGVAGQTLVAGATGQNFIGGMTGYFVDAQGNRIADGAVDVSSGGTATSATLALTLPKSAPDADYPDEVWVELSIGGKPSAAYPFGLATQAVRYVDQIQEYIFETDCTDCHTVPSPTPDNPNPSQTWKPDGQLDLSGNAALNGVLIGVVAPLSLPAGDTNPVDGIPYVRGCAPPAGESYEQANFLLHMLTPPAEYPDHMSFDQMTGTVFCDQQHQQTNTCPNVTADQKKQALLDWIATGASWQ